MARPAWQKALMGTVFAASLLWVGELALGLAGVAPAYSAEAVAGWRVAGGLESAAIQGPRDGHAFGVSTNAAGLRTDLPVERSPGVKRVALMGDSTVFGWGVDDGQSVADGLSRALAAEHPELGPVEVLNAGQPGYSTVQASWLFREVVADYQPDLTVVFLPLHDGNLVLVSDREHLEGARGPLAMVRVGLARHSRTYALLRQLVFQRSADAAVVPNQGEDSEPRVPRVDDEDRAWAVEAMQARASDWGGRVGVGLLPFQGDLTTHRPVPRPSSVWAEAYAEGSGMPVLDVRACCGPDGQELLLPDDPGHLSAAGNEAVGASLAPAVAGLLGDGG